MTFKPWFLSAVGVLVVFNMIACGKNETTNTDIATVPGVTATCPPGYNLVTVNGGYQMCQNGSGGVVTPIYPYSNAGLAFASDNYCYKSLSITNQTQAQKFLKEAMGVCDQNYSTGGNAACSSFTAGSFKLVVNLANSTIVNGAQNAMTATIMAYPQNTGYYYSLPSLSDFFLGIIGFPVYNTSAYATRNPLGLGMSTFLINNSNGFEGRSNGELHTLANRSLIQVQIPTGKPTDTHFNYVLGYEGVAFMSGTLVNSANYTYYCGF